MPSRDFQTTVSCLGRPISKFLIICQTICCPVNMTTNFNAVYGVLYTQYCNPFTQSGNQVWFLIYLIQYILQLSVSQCLQFLLLSLFCMLWCHIALWCRELSERCTTAMVECPLLNHLLLSHCEYLIFHHQRWRLARPWRCCLLQVLADI